MRKRPRRTLAQIDRDAAAVETALAAAKPAQSAEEALGSGTST